MTIFVKHSGKNDGGCLEQEATGSMPFPDPWRAEGISHLETLVGKAWFSPVS